MSSECAERGLRIRLFRGPGAGVPYAPPVYSPLPAADLRELESDFGHSAAAEEGGGGGGGGGKVRRPPPPPRTDRLCRGLVAGRYGLWSVRSADLVCVARLGGGAGPVVGVLTAFRPGRIHPDEGVPYCLPHEIYVDVVCSRPHPGGCGRLLFDAFLRYLRTAPAEVAAGVRAVRMHATNGARPLWMRRWKFAEAETRIDSATGRCVYTAPGPRTYNHEVERNLGRTWRLTLIL